MGHGANSFKESDVKRALRAIEAAGKKVASVEIEGFAMLPDSPR